MPSFRTQIILTDIAIFVMVVLIHAAYVGLFAFILGADVPSSIALGLIGGVIIRNFMARSLDADRKRQADRARESYKRMMEERPKSMFYLGRK